jgi:hypothetical protein
MKKINLILACLALTALGAVGQYPEIVQSKIADGKYILEVPTSYITSTAAVRDSFINWGIRSELISLGTSTNGTMNSFFEITNNWNPSNTTLNPIEVAGGNTINWPLFLTVNDSTFFTENISIYMGGDTLAIYGRYAETLRTWGDYLPQTHEIYYYANPNPDQYVILAADNNGNILPLSVVRDIVADYSPKCAGYRTNYAVNALKASMVLRSLW